MMEIEANDASVSLENPTRDITLKEDEAEVEIEVEAKSCFVFTQESFPRKWFLRIFKNRWFERISMFVIFMNCVTLAMYDPYDRQCRQLRCTVLENLEHFIFAFFLLEMAIKMVAMGIVGKRGYMKDAWNRLDFVIIIVGVIEKLMEGSNYLTIIRAFRVLRPLRAINKVPSIRILVTLLLDTLPMLGNVLLLTFFIFFVFGIIGVQLWRGKLRNRCFVDVQANSSILLEFNKSLFYKPSFEKPDFICSLPSDHGMTRCSDVPSSYQNNLLCTQSPYDKPNSDQNNSPCVDWNRIYNVCKADGPNPFHGTASFDNLALAWIAIFQVITLEGWSEIMYLVQDSHSLWNWIYFIILVVIGSFFLVNLCLVVITMQFQETKAREIEMIEENRKRQSVNISSMQTYSCLQTVKNFIRSKRAARRENVHHHHHHFYHHHHFHHHLYDCYSPASPLFLSPTETKSAFFDGKKEDTVDVPSITIDKVDTKQINKEERKGGIPHSKTFLCPPEPFLPRRDSEASLFTGAISIHTEASSSVRDKEILTTSSVTLTVPGTLPGGSFVAAHASVHATSSLPIIKVTSDDTLASAHASASVSADFSAEDMQTRPRSSSESCSKRCDVDLIPTPLSLRQQRRHSQPFGTQEIKLSKTSPMNTRKWKNMQEIEMKKLEIQTNQLNEESFVKKISTKSGKNDKHNSTLVIGNDDSMALLRDGKEREKQVTSCATRQLKHSERHKNNGAQNDDEIQDVGVNVCKESNISDGSQAGSTPKDDDIYDSVFDLRQRDSYDVKHKSGAWNCFRNFCRKIAESRHFIHFIMTSILLNMICMGMEHFNQPKELTDALDKSNIIFVTIFSVEMAINLVAYGVTEYLCQLLNVFDGFVVMVSIAELLVDNGQTKLSVFRSIRLLRIFKLVRPVRYQLLIVIRTMNSVITFFGLLFLFMFAFSILGMNLFGGRFVFANADNEKMVTRSNFDSFLWSMVTVFQILTQENWNVVMYDGMRSTNNWAAVYFIALMIIGYYVLFNLLVAILVEGFTSTGTNGTKSEGSAPNVVQTPSATCNPNDEKEKVKIRCDLASSKPLILINDEAEWDERCSRKPLSCDPDYCCHAVRRAFRTNTLKERSVNPNQSKSSKRRHNENVPGGISSSIPDVEMLDSFLTMPELKRKRQTSVGLLRKTRKNKSSQLTRSAILNPAFAIDVDPKNKIPDKGIKVINNNNDKGAGFNSKCSHKKSHEVFHNIITKEKDMEMNDGEILSNAANPGPENSIEVAALAGRHAEMTPEKKTNENDTIVEIETSNQVGLFAFDFEVPEDQSPSSSNPVYDTTDAGRQQQTRRENIVQVPESTARRCFSSKSNCSLYLFSPKNRFRITMVRVCTHKIFDYVILVFILMSCAMLAMEGPEVDQDFLKRQIIDVSMLVFTVVFTIEMVMKIIAMGFVLGPDTYLKVGWNILDFVLVLTSWLDVVITHVPQASVDVLGTLKVFRALRTLRPLRMIRRAPGLKLVVQTLLYSLKPIGNTVLIAGIFYVMFGILGVQLFKGTFFYCEGDSHVINRTQCLNSTSGHWVNARYNFDNLLQALISLFVVSTRDGWVQVMRHGIDAVGVDMQPVVNHAEWCLIYFIPFLLLGGFLVLNMIVGVVVENFQRCRAKLDEEEEKRPKEEAKRKAKSKGDEHYYAQYNMIRRRIHDVCMHQYWDICIAVIICLNVISMSLEHYDMSKNFDVFVETTNYFFTAVFVLEAALKLCALGILRYLKDRWNIVDLIIVILSVSGILLTDLVQKDLPINPTVIRTLRVLRIIRVLKLVKLAKGVRSLLDTLFEALPQVANLGLLFLLLFFIYSCLGIQLFGSLECSHDYPCEGFGRHAHFRNLGSAMLTLFRIATGDNWNGILKDTLRIKCDSSANCRKNCCITKYTAPLYFVTFVLSAQFVLVNVVIAVLMKHLKESKDKLAATLAAKDLEKKLKVLTLVAKNFIRSKASRKPTPITRRRSVVELGLGGIELTQLKNHNKKWLDDSFYQEVVKADAIFQRFIQLNASLRKAKMKACRTTSSILERVVKSDTKMTCSAVTRRHTLAELTDLSTQETSAHPRRVIWKSGCDPL